MSNIKETNDVSHGIPSVDALALIQKLMTPAIIQDLIATYNLLPSAIVAKLPKVHVVNIPTASHAAGTPVEISTDDIPVGSEIVKIEQLGGASGDSFTITDNNSNTISVVAGTAANTFTLGTLIKTYKTVVATGLLVTAADTSDTCDLYIWYI